MTLSAHKIGMVLFTAINTIPIFVALGVLKFYIAAKDILGHFPRSSIDDPANLPISSEYTFLGNWLCVSYYILLGGLLLILLFRKKLPSQNRNLITGIVVANWALYICLHSIPGINILEWYLD